MLNASITFTVPLLTYIPPPLVLAVLYAIDTLLMSIVLVASYTYIPPPLLAVLFSIREPEGMENEPYPVYIPPPLLDAVLFLIVIAFSNVNVKALLMAKPPPLPEDVFPSMITLSLNVAVGPDTK